MDSSKSVKHVKVFSLPYKSSPAQCDYVPALGAALAFQSGSVSCIPLAWQGILVRAFLMSYVPSGTFCLNHVELDLI